MAIRSFAPESIAHSAIAMIAGNGSMIAHSSSPLAQRADGLLSHVSGSSLADIGRIDMRDRGCSRRTCSMPTSGQSILRYARLGFAKGPAQDLAQIGLLYLLLELDIARDFVSG